MLVRVVDETGILPARVTVVVANGEELVENSLPPSGALELPIFAVASFLWPRASSS